MGIFSWFFKSKELYEYGTCKNRIARRNLSTGDVQFVLWKAGEQGHKVDFWISFGFGHSYDFIPDRKI